MNADAVVNLIRIPWYAFVHVNETEDVNDRLNQVRFARAVLADDHCRETAVVEVDLDILKIPEPVDVELDGDASGGPQHLVVLIADMAFIDLPGKLLVEVSERQVGLLEEFINV